MCKLCDKDPESHSFYKLATEDDAVIIYSCPGDAKATDKESVVNHISEVLDQQNGKKWVWIIDGKGFGVRQASRVTTSTAIMNLITSTYNDSLTEIRIVNPTKYVVGIFKTIVPFMHPSLKKKIVWRK
jgi:hypothetical protein